MLYSGKDIKHKKDNKNTEENTLGKKGKSVKRPKQKKENRPTSKSKGLKPETWGPAINGGMEHMTDTTWCNCCKRVIVQFREVKRIGVWLRPRGRAVSAAHKEVERSRLSVRGLLKAAWPFRPDRRYWLLELYPTANNWTKEWTNMSDKKDYHFFEIPTDLNLTEPT